MTLPVYATVEDAIAQVARFTDGKSMTAVAAEMGWTVDQLSKASDPNAKPRFAASWIVPLTLTTHNFAIVRTICRLVGMVAVPIPKPGCTPTDVIGGITEITREYSEAMAALTPCLDGATPQERRDAATQLTDLIEKASALRAHLESSK